MGMARDAGVFCFPSFLLLLKIDVGWQLGRMLAGGPNLLSLSQ